MSNRLFLRASHPYMRAILWLCLCLLLLAACGGTKASPLSSRPTLRQVLLLPDVGIQDFDTLDPAQGTDQNSMLAMNMLYSGLVRLDQNLNLIPDQATWTISDDRKVYTFHLKAGITFSDGTPVNAQSYVYTLTRALLPATKSDEAMLFLGNIVGAAAVNSGKAKALSGVKAIDASTLTITLTRPTDYFLQTLANPLTFALNQKFIQQYGESDWPNHMNGSAVGSGPFMVKRWEHNTKMVLVPNPHYYGPHTRLTEVDMIFVADAHTAFQAYQGGQYTFVWNIIPNDLAAAHGLAGFASSTLLQTDALFFNTQMPPFDQPAVRQAFAYAIDKSMLAQSVLNDAVVPAPTIVPPGVPGYQPDLAALSFDRAKALALLKSAYSDISQVPTVTFTYPNSLVAPAVAASLQQMLQNALGISVKLSATEPNAYNIEVANHLVQFGFTQWSADFPDPYDVLALNLASSAPANAGGWSNDTFDQFIQQAEATSGAARLAFYAQAEQVAINDVGWLPLDHQTMSAVIPAYVHGVKLNAMGLYFGDWSDVYLLPH
ncbi:MAG TPA: peptide ABC transporter substrate-binding protein [Ktedonobacteraceae bacterium]|nr:peptide ABC transporter substrate-binding protein [Ktedonobacteraceae bacterium]